MLGLQLLPDCIGTFSHSALRNEIAGHGGQDVIVIFEGLDAVGYELSFQRKRHEHFLAHETKTVFLRRTRVVEVDHAHGLFLSNPPASSARLPKDISGVAGLNEEY